MAVVVSKKIDKSAVVRNRIRRRLYEAVRKQVDLLQGKSVDMVFVVKNSSLKDNDWTELYTDVEKTLKRISTNKQHKKDVVL